MLIVPLVPIEVLPGHGIYPGPDGLSLPPRMRWLAPDAAASWAIIQESVVISDAYRSAESSLVAMTQKSGVLPPAFSRHGYGRALDLDVTKTLKMGQFASKIELDVWMEGRGWYCHRLDHKSGSESWHFNYLPGVRQGAGVHRPGERSTGLAGERELSKLFGEQWNLTPKETQRALALTKFYGGPEDGILGKFSRAAGEAFARAWRIPLNNFDARFRRVLAFVAAGSPVASGSVFV